MPSECLLVDIVGVCVYARCSLVAVFLAVYVSNVLTRAVSVSVFVSVYFIPVPGLSASTVTMHPI